MSKTKEYGWNIPDDVHVEVNGETLPVPEVDDFTRDSIISLSDNEDNLRDLRNVIRWLKSRNDKEIAAAFQYLLDRWTWETGSPTDKFFYGMLEDECRDRKILMDKIKPLIKEIAEKRKEFDDYVETVLVDAYRELECDDPE
jgi:hypothetical protein